jgi:hypothetical protein
MRGADNLDYISRKFMSQAKKRDRKILSTSALCNKMFLEFGLLYFFGTILSPHVAVTVHVVIIIQKNI